MARAPAQAAGTQAPGAASRAGLAAAYRDNQARAAWLALALVIAAGLLQTAIRFHHYHLGLIGDDFDFLLAREGLSAHTLLAPHNENLVAVGVLLYRAIFAFVGISTATPYIALLFLSVGACAVLAYVFVRRELGPWLALIVPLVLVTLGPAAEALLWPFEFTLLSALAFWLAAMLLIERGDTRTDLAGCGLLILAIGSEAIAVALLPATLLALVLWRGWRRALRGAWIAAVPLVLYGIWYLVYRPEELHRSLGKAPGFVVDSFVAAVADISGVGHHSPYTGVLAAAVIVAACLRCLQLRRVPTTTAYMAAGLLSVWLAGGTFQGVGRAPAQSRYQFHDSLLLMLALAPLVPRPSPTRRLIWRLAGAVVLVALLVAIVALNLNRYRPFEEGFQSQESIANAELAALQTARQALATPNQVFTGVDEPGLYWPFTPKAYLAAIDAHGSPVRVRQDLELAPQPDRVWADTVLVRVEGITFNIGTVSTGSIRPRSASGAALRPAGAGCSIVPAGAAASGLEVVAPAGGLIIRPAAGQPVSIGVARFADPPSAIPLPSVASGSAAVIPIRPDSSSVPWRFRLTGAQAVTVCSIGE
jgi:hypothetical protein